MKKRLCIKDKKTKFYLSLIVFFIVIILLWPFMPGLISYLLQDLPFHELIIYILAVVFMSIPMVILGILLLKNKHIILAFLQPIIAFIMDWLLFGIISYFPKSEANEIAFGWGFIAFVLFASPSILLIYSTLITYYIYSKIKSKESPKD